MQVSLLRLNDGPGKKQERNVLAGWGIAGRTGNTLTVHKAMKQYSSCAFERSLDKVAFMVEHLLKLHLRSEY